MELITDLRTAGRTILKQPQVLLLAVGALAQGLVLNGLVMAVATNYANIHQAARYVAFLITLS